MSVGIVRVQKMTSGSVKGIEIHDRREMEGVSHSNPDIDWERSKSNYDLHPDQNDHFYQKVKEIIGELHLPKAVRKDAVVLAQVLVTSENDFFKGRSPESTKQFFQDSYKFLCERYGEKNVVSATVHLDERTPHMHFNFVPVTPDGRLSAKSILTKQSLIDQQDRFQKEVGSKYGLERGMTKGQRIEKGLQRKNFTMPEYKAVMNDIHKAQRELQKLEAERDKLLATIKSSRGELKLMQNIDAIPVKHSLGGDKVTISSADFTKMKELARQSNRLIEDNKSMKKRLEADKGKTSIEVSLLRAEISQLKEQIANPRSLKENLKKANLKR